MIRIKGSFIGEREDGAPFGEPDAARVVDQLARDSTAGSFGEFPDAFWSNHPQPGRAIRNFRRLVGKAATVERLEQSKAGRWEFTIGLDEARYPPEHGGARHLVGVIAGDWFALSIPGYRIDQLRVDDIAWRSYLNRVGKARHKSKLRLDEMRESFRLRPEEPLLAFSLKPRIGLDLEHVRRIAIEEVLSNGFQIVELDTRHIPFGQAEMNRWVGLATDIADEGRARGKVWRLSLNMSVSPVSPVELAALLLSAHENPVIKVDGGLDGLATLESIRDRHANDVVVTCYPLLTKALSGRLPSYGFTDLLAVGGADIIYPGGCPQFGTSWRRIEASTLRSGVERYRKIVARGETMPTVAGGIHAGQIHAYYELLGPSVAYFIGGGVALHKKGASEGARLCRKAVDEAISSRSRTATGRVSEDVRSTLVLRSQNAYAQPDWMPDDCFQYIPPRELIAEHAGLESRLWFNWGS